MNHASKERVENLMAEINGLSDVREQIDRIDEVFMLESTGCVVRSLESALGYPATIDEMRLRTGQIHEVVKDVNSFRFDYHSDLGREIIRHVDRKLVDCFIQKISTHNTPLGIAISRHKFDRVTLTCDEIDKVLDEKSTLLLSIGFQGYRGHMAHVQKVDGKIVQPSDEGEIATLVKNQTYEGILITSN